MGKVAIQNIKILHKRYTFTEWNQGRTSKGVALTLDKGELGFDLTNLVLKIGTADGQSWANAHEVCAATLVHKYKVGEQYTESKPSDTTNYFVSKVEEVAGASGTKLVYYYDEVIIPDAPALTFVDDTTTTATKGGVVVVADIAQDSSDNHKLTETKVEVATPSQVDSKVKVVSDKLDAHTISVTKDGDGMFITGVKSVTTENNEHKVVLSSGTLEIDMPEASGEVVANGTSGKTISYVKSVTLSEDGNGDHVLSGETDTITIPTGTGTVGTDTTTSTTVATKLVLNDHVLEGESKDIVSATGSKVQVTGTDTQILIGVDLSDFATKSDVSAAVSSATHYAGTITPGSSTSPLNLATLEDTTNGALYIATVDGYVIDATNGIHDDTHTNSVKTKIKIKKGDSVLLHVAKSDTHWDVITAGDDVEYRPIKVNGTEILGLNNSSAVDIKSATNGGVDVNTNAGENGVQEIVIKHSDTSSASNVTKKARQYIDGIELDGFGHITKLTVGEEVDQNASGGQTAGNLSVISQATLTKDSNGDIVLTTDTKSFDDDGKYISVEESNGVITISHDEVTKNDTTSTAAPDYKGSFTVIDGVTRDDAGHVIGVNTKTVTLPELPDDVFTDTKDDTDTRYDVSAEQVSSTAGQTSAKINLNSTLHDVIANTSTAGATDSVTIKVDSSTTTPANGLQVSTSGDTITISGKATDQLLGLIRAFSSLSGDQAAAIGAAVQSYTGDNMGRLYGVNTLPDGKAFVEVPWENTHSVANRTGGAINTVDMYAFSTDAYGHIGEAHAVTVIDGNYTE